MFLDLCSKENFKADKKPFFFFTCVISFLLEWLGVASESAKVFWTNLYYWYLLKKISSKLPTAKTSHSSKNLRPYFNSKFFLRLNFYFDHKTFRGLETFRSMFLSLFRKFPADIESVNPEFALSGTKDGCTGTDTVFFQ